MIPSTLVNWFLCGRAVGGGGGGGVGDEVMWDSSLDVGGRPHWSFVKWAKMFVWVGLAH